MKRIATIVFASLLITACGKDDNAPKEQAAAPASPAASTAAAPAPAAAASSEMPATDGGTMYIDHAKDEVEFALKKSLAGMESLLEDVTDEEQVAIIKKEIADLQAKLSDL